MLIRSVCPICGCYLAWESGGWPRWTCIHVTFRQEKGVTEFDLNAEGLDALERMQQLRTDGAKT